jgi:enoyl-[acyl-carrier protein] reductase II
VVKTRVTEILGIEHPIIQGAMVWVSFPPLVAAVSEAGGLGILGAAAMSASELETNIKQIKQLTQKPFGVNFIPESEDIEDLLDVMIAEKVHVLSYGRGNPQRIIERSRGKGIVNMPTMGSVKHAVRAEENGADMVIVQGNEAGGHNSPVATSVLVPRTVDEVKIPVVAAGGFGDGRGLAAALALGAEGISMGTRFICTRECPVPEHIKDLYLRADEESTMVTGHISGVRARVLPNKLTESFKKLEEKHASLREHMLLGLGRTKLTFSDGDADWGSQPAGHAVGLIKDIPSCRELIDRIVNEAKDVIERTKRMFVDR